MLYRHMMRLILRRPGPQPRPAHSVKASCPAQYVVLSQLGVFPQEMLGTLRQLGSPLQGHPDMHKLPGIDLSTGSLGLGLSAGVGMALAAALDGAPWHVYVILGDGELQEGMVWEAVAAAAKYKLTNLTAVVDLIGVQLDGTIAEIMPLGDVVGRFRAQGWNPLLVDGHDVAQLAEAFAAARGFSEGPCVILAQTVKGKGVSFMEGRHEWHGKVIDEAAYKRALAELGGTVNG